MENLPNLIFVTFITCFILWFVFSYKGGMFQGSKHSREFSKEKLRYYATGASEFMIYEDFVKTIQLERGDRIECKRKAYYDHWAVYVGNGEEIETKEDFIHITPTLKGTEIRKDKLKNVVKDSDCRVNNKIVSGLKRGLNPRSGDAIAQSAIKEWEKFQNKLKGKEDETVFKKYNLMEFNCEHFATYCAFGEPFSEQIELLKDKPYPKAIGEAVVTIAKSATKNQDNDEL